LFVVGLLVVTVGVIVAGVVFVWFELV